MIIKDLESEYFGRDLEAMSFALNYHKWILAEAGPFLGKEVAEVGAGSGNFSELLLDYVDSIIGFEPSENMFPLLKSCFENNPRVRVEQAFFGNRVEVYENYFDSLVYVNVLEHIEDDKAEMAYMFRSLKPGGHALVFVPACPFLYGSIDKDLGHFRRYRKSGLLSLAAQQGFEVSHARYFDIAGMLPWYVSFVMLNGSLTPGKVKLYDRFVVPIMRRIESLVRPPIGKNLLVILKKPAL